MVLGIGMIRVHLNIKSFTAKFPKIKVIPNLVALFWPALIPPAHIAILWYFWQNYHRFVVISEKGRHFALPIFHHAYLVVSPVYRVFFFVDKRFCSCSCWDTVFKGTYESGIASYKHMYFNATTNTLKMWILIVSGIISLYESMKHLTKLMMSRQIRFTMVLLFILSIFSHYYSFWAYLNYYNDDYYDQFYHQLFFTLTELCSTANVLHLANLKNQVTSRKCLNIIGIAILHIAAGGADQFISNVFRGEGYAHQIVRDLGFMIPDILHLVIPIWLLKQSRQDIFSSRPFYRDRILRREVMGMTLIVLILFTICSFL